METIIKYGLLVVKKVWFVFKELLILPERSDKK